MRRPSAVAAVMLAAAMLWTGACRASSDTGVADTSPDVATPDGSELGELGAGNPRFLEHPEQVPDLIRKKFGEVPRFRRLNLTNDDLMIELRDPDKPENLDNWRYSHGQWTSTPVSVSLAEIEQFDQTTFGPESIAWDMIPDLIQAAYDGVELEEEEITSVSYDKIAGDPPRVYIGISGLRGNGRLLGLADGTQYEVQRN
ncbi:hypothetical protein BH10ACT3_BH10ACT3_19210 [soil metagenome]